MDKLQNTPEHIAIIMDGNGRWATENNLPISKGHTEGTKRIEQIVELCAKYGVKYLTLYAFSTENWKREDSEINHLMKLVKVFYNNKINKMIKNGIKINVIGSKKGVPEDILKTFEKMETKSKNNDKLILNIAFNYGSHEEMINAMNNIIDAGYKKVDKEIFESYLYTANMPDVDLLIRTSGEQRVSNFLLWQIAYSEFIFSEVYWPDFKEEEFYKCLEIYNNRNRRYGGR